MGVVFVYDLGEVFRGYCLYKEMARWVDLLIVDSAEK